MRRISQTLFAAVALAAGVLAAPARGADLEPLLPAETQQVFHVNFRQILDSDIIKKYALGQIKQAMKGQDAEKMFEALGLDPLKDIDRVAAGLWGASQEEMNGVVVVYGKFNAKKLFEAADAAAKDDKDKVSIVTDGDLKMVKITGEGKPFFVTVADEKTVVGASDKKVLSSAVAAFNKKAKPALKKDLSDLVLKQDQKASMFYCGVVDGQLSDIPNDFSQLKNLGIDGDEFKKQLGKMTTMSATVRLGEEISFDLTMGMKNADAADDLGVNMDKLVDAAKTFLPFAGTQAPQAKPVIDDIVKSIKTKVKEKEVTLGFKLSADAIAKASEGPKDTDK